MVPIPNAALEVKNGKRAGNFRRERGEVEEMCIADPDRGVGLVEGRAHARPRVTNLTLVRDHPQARIRGRTRAQFRVRESAKTPPSPDVIRRLAERRVAAPMRRGEHT